MGDEPSNDVIKLLTHEVQMALKLGEPDLLIPTRK